MKIQIELRRPRTWRSRVALLLVALVTVAVPVALATDRFIDVPAGNPHHNDINTIATAGITLGCNPPTNNQYCPDQFVRRDQMASFLQRGLGRAGRVHVSSAVTTTMSPVATVSLTVPGSGFVLVTATADISCTCEMWMQLTDPASGESSWIDGETGTGADSGTLANTFLFPVTAGARTVQVQARTTAGAGTVWVDATALWVPFGSTGGSALSVPATGASTKSGGANG